MVERSILRYHGGKWVLAPWILSHFPPHRVYVEPYGGAASVLLRKDRSYAEVYNDLDGELVNLFRVVRERGEELIRLLELTPFARDEFLDSYEPTRDPLEQARRTIIRSSQGFGSNGHNRVTGFRSNSNRSGTPAALAWRNYPDNLPAIIDRLRGVVLENRPALEVMAQHDSLETLHYVDPPYLPDVRDAGSDYRYEMTDGDHITMLDELKLLHGFVVLSGYPNPVYSEHLPDWQMVTRLAMADGARERTEALWINPRAWRALQHANARQVLL